MPRGRTALAFALSLFAAGALKAVVIESVAERAYSEENLTTLQEYLDGHERFGRRTFYRSSAERKAGLYLVADLDTPLSTLPAGSKIVVDYITSTDGGPRSATFPVVTGNGVMGRAVYVGLTDPAFEGLRFVAWRLTVVDASDTVLAESHSFLWEMPAK